MSINKKEIEEKRGLAGKRMQEILDKASSEGRSELNTDEAAEFDRADKDFESAAESLRRIDKVDEIKREQEERKGLTAEQLRISGDENNDNEEKYSRAFWKYVRTPKQVTSEEMQLLEERATRAQTITTTGGGYLIPQGFSNEVEMAMAEFGGVRSVARVIRTSSGNPLMWPMIDATSRTGRWLAINTASTTTDLTYGNTQLDAYVASSDTIKVPLQLVQDSAFDMSAHLRGILGDTLGRLENAAFTTGTGSTHPTGFMTSATQGVYSASGTSITMAELVKLEHSVDPAYRRSNSCVYMMNDTTIRDLKMLSIASGDARPVWQPGFIDGTPATINGYRYVVNQDMDSIAITKKPIAFGDFSKYIIRDSMDVVLLRLNELYAESLQVGYHAFHRTEGKLLDAGTNPVKYIQCAGT